MFANLKEHNNGLEHLLVSHFMKVRCCKRPFVTRAELEEHKLSLHHYRFVQKHGVAEPQLSKEEEEEKQHKEDQALQVLEEVHRKHITKEDPPLTPATLPPYDPEKPVGE